jgi:O-antigen ligase
MTARFDPARALGFAGLGLIAALVGALAGVEPKLAIVAAVGAAFVLIVFVDLAAGLAFFGFFSFIELLDLGSALSVGKLGGVLLLLGWLAYVLTNPQSKTDFIATYPGAAVLLVGFLTWVALSGLWAEDTGEVQSALWRYALNAVLFLIVFSAIRTRKNLVYVLCAFLLGAVAAGVYGLAFTSSVVPIEGRLTGTNLDPNELAAVLVAGMALSVGLAANLRDPVLRLLSLAGGGFCFLAAMLTGSRGGLVATACMLVAAVVFGGRWRGRLVVLGIVVALLGGFYITALAPSTVRERFTQTAGLSPEQEGRTTIWTVAERMVEAHPVEGVGAGNFQVSSKKYVLQPGSLARSDEIFIGNKVTHNTYLQTAAELGVIGLVLFLGIIAFSFWCLVAAAQRFRRLRDIRAEALTRSLIVAMVGLLAADFFISEMFSKQLWLMLGIGPAVLAMARRADPVQTSVEPTRKELAGDSA